MCLLDGSREYYILWYFLRKDNIILSMVWGHIHSSLSNTDTPSEKHLAIEFSLGSSARVEEKV